jgi:hypothetical protein
VYEQVRLVLRSACKDNNRSSHFLPTLMQQMEDNAKLPELP